MALADRGGGSYRGTPHNCIVYYNSASGSGADWELSTLTNCCSPGLSGSGNITDRPLFADATGRLLPGSPCIDAGTTMAGITNPSAYDLYTSNQIMGVGIGAMTLRTSNGWLRLRLQLEQTEDLTSGVWSNAGDAVEWLEPAGDGKAFYRVMGR